MSRLNLCQIYFQMLNLIMPFLLDQDYPKSIVVKKALNSLMGLYCKEKKINAKEKNNTSHPLAVLSVVASHPWGIDQLGEMPCMAKWELPQNGL